jgi:hypothetical protein
VSKAASRGSCDILHVKRALTFHSSYYFTLKALFFVLLSTMMASQHGSAQALLSRSLAVFLLLLFIASPIQARQLKADCTASSSAIASGESENAVAKASSQAFAECKTCPCIAQVQSSAEAVSLAVAKAIASVTVSVRGSTKGCQTSASGSAQGSATATALAEAWARSAANACGAKASSASKAISAAFASAAARAEAAVAANGGNADATATSVAQVSSILSLFFASFPWIR